MKSGLVLLLLCLAPLVHADGKMDIILQQGTSAYESGDYETALGHFTAGLVYAVESGESPMYPASYLCGAWYHGKGVDKNLTRAERACGVAQGNKSDYQLELFQGVLESNGAPDSTFTFKEAMRDASEALKWYMGNGG